MMPCRKEILENTLEALTITDTPLVALNGDTYDIPNIADDQGIFYFIPYLAKTFSLTAESATLLFFNLLMYSAIIVSVCCFLMVFKSWPARILSAVGLLKLGYCRFWDVYLIMYFAVAILVPLFMVLQKKSVKLDLRFSALLAVSGIIIGYANFLRGHAGTGVFIFIALWLFLRKGFALKEKLSSLVLLSIFAFLPHLHIKHLEDQRDRFLAKTNPSHSRASVSHPLWHNAYIGLGYLPNDYQIRWGDGCGFDKVKTIDPSAKFYSDTYLQILKNEIIKMLRSDPMFLLKTLVYKMFVILLMVLKYSNVGLLFLFYVKPPFREFIPMIASSLFFAIPGLLAIPKPEYLSGMITLVSLFSIYLCSSGVEQFVQARRKLKRRFS